MYKLMLLLLVTTLLNASHPKIYAALGDKIYENVNKINSLKNLEAYKFLEAEIELYVKEVYKTKQKGFSAEHSQESDLLKSYLMDLRKLSKLNDNFFRSARNNYDVALKTRDNELFIGVINSGLLDTAEHKQEILEYYYEHLNDSNVSGVLASLVFEDRELKKKRDLKVVNKKTKKMYEDEKIKRIRENDLKAHKKLEEKLQDELSKKKQEIRKDQKEALRL